MAAVRKAIRASGRRWRFAFFDREPHALFGEEVKTRNAIALRFGRSDDAGGCVATIETGPLRKWTSRQRPRLFDTIDFTPMEDDGLSIGAGIPKLAGEESARVFGRLTRRPSRLREMCSSIGSCLPEEVSGRRGQAIVFVSGTAYNFLNVFRPHRKLPVQLAPWSSSKVVAPGFTDEGEAARGFALLGSRVSYWLWRVNEDGFHVTRSFLTELPFNDRIFSETDRNVLTGLGARLWDAVQTRQVVSINGDRQTVAYRPDAAEGVRDEVDALLLGALDIPPSFLEYLQKFTCAVANVAEHEEVRPRAAPPLASGASGTGDPLRRAVRGGGVVTGPAISTACPPALGRVRGPAPVDSPWKSLPAPPLGGRFRSANSGRYGPSCYSAGHPIGPNKYDRGSPNTEFLTPPELAHHPHERPGPFPRVEHALPRRAPRLRVDPLPRAPALPRRARPVRPEPAARICAGPSGPRPRSRVARAPARLAALVPPPCPGPAHRRGARAFDPRPPCRPGASPVVAGPLHAVESVRAGGPGSVGSERRPTRTSWERRVRRTPVSRPHRSAAVLRPICGRDTRVRGAPAFRGRAAGIDVEPRAGQRERALR